MKRLLVLLCVLALAFVGCGDEEPATDTGAPADESSAPAEDGGGEVVVTAVEYEFDLADSYPAGATTFSLQNDGEEPHFIDIVELTEDAPALDELLKMKEKEIGQYFVGQPNHIPVAKPGEAAKKSIEIDLTPGGRYAYVCFIEAKDGTPHAFLGMAGEFTVE
jgi:hypothetical protein